MQANLTTKSKTLNGGNVGHWITKPAVKIPMLTALLFFLSIGSSATSTQVSTKTIALDRLDDFALRNVKVDLIPYKGRPSLRVIDATPTAGDGERLVILTTTAFQNGVIEFDVTGEPMTGAPETARGFVGLAFRVSPDGSKYECFYLRPTNGRADDRTSLTQISRGSY